MNSPTKNRSEDWFVGFVVVVGLLLCLSVLWLFVFRTGSSARQGTNESAAERMREFRESSEVSATAGMAERFVRIQQEWSKTGATLQGDDRRVAEVFTALFEELSPKVNAYDHAYTALADAGFASPPFADAAEIKNRRTFVAAFSQANAELRSAFEEILNNLKSKLAAVQVPQPMAESNIRSFLNALKVEETVKLRELDAETANLMLQILDLYEKNWSKWTVTEAGDIRFDESNAQASFDQFRDRLHELALEQQSLQERILGK